MSFFSFNKKNNTKEMESQVPPWGGGGAVREL